MASLISTQAKQIKAAVTTNAPLTSPLTYTISGQIWYQFKSGTVLSPAANVRIDIYDTIHHIGSIYYTDQQGRFTVYESPSTYTVTPSDSYNTVFTPSKTTVVLDRDVTLRFIGYRNPSTTSVK